MSNEERHHRPNYTKAVIFLTLAVLIGGAVTYYVLTRRDAAQLPGPDAGAAAA